MEAVHARKMPIGFPAMRYFSRIVFFARDIMSKADSVVLASRTLALLLVVWALADLSHLPGTVYTFVHYANVELSSPLATQYYRHSDLIALSFLFTRIIGFSLLARWLFKGGPEVAELLLPNDSSEPTVQMGRAENEPHDIR
jgi:hypothetical protein